MNQLNAINDNDLTETKIESNSQPPEAHLKSSTSPPKTSPVVSYIMWIFNHRVIDNGDVDVHPSEFPVKSNSESVPDLDTTPIK